MAKNNTALALLAGAAVGGVALYAISGAKAKSKPKKKNGKTTTDTSDVPEETSGAHGAYYRAPMPDTIVKIPTSQKARKELDAAICKVVATFTDPPEPQDVILGVLEIIAPAGEWPAIKGDHSSMVATQAIVGLRVDQVAYDSDPARTPQENLKAFCKAGIILGS